MLIFLWFLESIGKFVVINSKKIIILVVLSFCFKIIFVKKIFIFCNIIGIGINGRGIFGIIFKI